MRNDGFNHLFSGAHFMGKVYWKITNSAWFGDKILRDALVLFRGMNTARNGLYFFKATISDKQMVIFVLRVCYVSFGRQAMKPWLLDSDTVQVPASGPGGSSPRWRDCSHAWRLAVFFMGVGWAQICIIHPFQSETWSRPTNQLHPASKSEPRSVPCPNPCQSPR